MNSRKTTHALRVFCIVAGAFIAVIPALDEITSTFSYRVLALPLLLCAGIFVATVSIADSSTDHRRIALTAGGIGVLLMAFAGIVIFQSGGGSVAYFVIFALPVFVGYAGFIGSVAYLFWAAPNIHVSRWIPVLLVMAPIIDPIANGIWVTILPAGVSVVGLVWVLTGLVLRPTKVG